ncbi:unnamed protein product [Rotaria socialis]|uniref:YHYH domain-containing protein n=1 Tax=Rotaria socialis TaxID=392032 RepID=A0A821EZA5_9BILA|nr:unnamed protein product [Rotaria socialis]CAF4643559.1 unnamed protein product [Rotaria socialis]
MKSTINFNIHVSSLVFILLGLTVNQAQGTASNNLTNCQSVASSFRTTVSGPVANITSTTGTNVTCTSLSGSSCPGSNISGSCVFQHRLSVSCYLSGSTVKIRIQSNGLPYYCPSMPSSDTFAEQNIDFEVNFNPDVSVNSPLQSATTVSALSTLLCNIQGSSNPPSGSAYVNYGSSYSTLAGVSVDGVSIMNVNSLNNVDPFYPAGSFAAESVDTCLAHCQAAGIYHYHMGSGCAKANPSSGPSACASVPTCSSNISNYGISSFSSYTTLTVIGISRDGHVIYGPYTSSGVEVTSGTDICNGMFYDSIGNYAYFATRKFPYITGCYGPGNYPSVSVNCSTNAPSSYTMSSYASALSSSNVTTVSTNATTVSSNTTTTIASNTTRSKALRRESSVFLLLMTLIVIGIGWMD